MLQALRVDNIVMSFADFGSILHLSRFTLSWPRTCTSCVWLVELDWPLHVRLCGVLALIVLTFFFLRPVDRKLAGHVSEVVPERPVRLLRPSKIMAYMRSESTPFGRSDSSLSSKSLGGLKRAVYGALVLFTCALILMQHVWYAHEMVTEVNLNADPRTGEVSLLQESNLLSPEVTKNPAHSLGEVSDLEIGGETEGANATESARSKADRVVGGGDGGSALNVRNKLVTEDLEQKEKPEEAVTVRNANATEDQEREGVIPRAIPRAWEAPKRCAKAEEMGSATVGNTRAASLRLRAMIRSWEVRHGAERVRNLPAEEFCRESFVLGQALEDGFGNNMYKALTAAGIAVMLNRSLIIGAVPPQFSKEMFTVREVRRLWAIHGCETHYNRSLIVQTDTVDAEFRHTRCMCDDWTTLTVPVFEFKGATGAGAIQLLLKNAHPAMRAAAVKLLGNPAVPDSRPNTFGELFRAFIAPNADIQAAVQWALKGGPDPDVSLHLRIMHSKQQSGQVAAASCIHRIRKQISLKHPSRGQRPRVVVVTDTPSIVPALADSLGFLGMELIRFDYKEFAKGSNVRESDSVLSLKSGLPAPERVKDWGEMPRWVAIVDFFLAARARTAVVSGAIRRVSTTYAQLVAALAAAYSLDNAPHLPACVYYSSFQPDLLATGLKHQSGWGFSWRTFGGKLGCRNQATQCAKTALLPYAWWDAPWQSPIRDDIAILHDMTGLNSAGQVSENAMDQYCAVAQQTELPTTTLVVPSYEQAIASAS